MKVEGRDLLGARRLLLDSLCTLVLATEMEYQARCPPLTIRFESDLGIEDLIEKIDVTLRKDLEFLLTNHRREQMVLFTSNGKANSWSELIYTDIVF